MGKGADFMPLTMAEIGNSNTIKRIGGKEEVKRFLANLVLIEGSIVKVITSISGNVIVDIMGTRVAISSKMAEKIYI